MHMIWCVPAPGVLRVFDCARRQTGALPNAPNRRHNIWRDSGCLLAIRLDWLIGSVRNQWDRAGKQLSLVRAQYCRLVNYANFAFWEWKQQSGSPQLDIPAYLFYFRWQSYLQLKVFAYRSMDSGPVEFVWGSFDYANEFSSLFVVVCAYCLI